MTLQATSLLSLMLAGSSLLPPNHQNLLKRNGKEMEILAAIGVRSPIRQQSEQLSLFDRLVVMPEVVKQDIQAPADQRSGAVAVVGQVHNLLKFVDVVLSQSQSDFLNNRLHGHAPEDMSSVHHEGTQRTCEISACGTGTLTVEQGPDFDVPSNLESESEDYLKVTLPQEVLEVHLRGPLDHILGRPRADHRDKPTLDQVKRAREKESKDFLQERVLARLEQLEAHEPNTSLRSDYRQAFIAVSLAAKGNPQAFLESSYAVHGIHPDKVWPRILANRKERLGKEYPDFFFPDDTVRPDIPHDKTVIYDLPNLNVERHSTNREACKTEKELTDISSPRRLRVKGTDTDSLTGCRVESGETGIPASDSPSEDRPIAHDARPGETYTTAVNPGYSADSSLAANRAASPSTAAKGGDGPETGREPSPLPPTHIPNIKEKLA